MINSYQNSIVQLNDLEDLYNLAIDESNDDVKNEVIKNVKNLNLLVKKNEVKCFLSNEADSLDCYIENHPEDGGTES